MFAGRSQISRMRRKQVLIRNENGGNHFFKNLKWLGKEKDLVSAGGGEVWRGSGECKVRFIGEKGGIMSVGNRRKWD